MLLLGGWLARSQRRIHVGASRAQRRVRAHQRAKRGVQRANPSRVIGTRFVLQNCICERTRTCHCLASGVTGGSSFFPALRLRLPCPASPATPRRRGHRAAPSPQITPLRAGRRAWPRPAWRFAAPPARRPCRRLGHSNRSRCQPVPLISSIKTFSPEGGGNAPSVGPSAWSAMSPPVAAPPARKVRSATPRASRAPDIAFLRASACTAGHFARHVARAGGGGGSSSQVPKAGASAAVRHRMCRDRTDTRPILRQTQTRMLYQLLRACKTLDHIRCAPPDPSPTAWALMRSPARRRPGYSLAVPRL